MLHCSESIVGRCARGVCCAAAVRVRQQAMIRDEAQQRFGEDYVGFLRSSEIVLSIRLVESTDRERLDDLVQRTNQLNFSGRKYKRSELQPILDDAALEKYVLDCTDRFGSCGTAGFAIVRRNSVQVDVDDFMLSCRVQGKLLERAFFSYLQSNTSSWGVRAALGELRAHGAEYPGPTGAGGQVS
jgi:FkbH-like protein